MKKVFLSFLLAFICLQVSAADLPLSLNDIVVYQGDNLDFDPATGVVTFGKGANNANNWNAALGWEFSPAINLAEYTAVLFEFEPVTANMVEIKVKYVGVATEGYVSIAKGSTT